MDAALHQTPDGAEMTIVNGVVTLDDGLATAVYLSLFGGEGDWWGNLSEVDESRHIRSKTLTVIDSVPLTSANLRRIEEAAISDLEWLSSGIATDLDVTAKIPALNTVQIDLVLALEDEQEARFSFTRTRSA